MIAPRPRLYGADRRCGSTALELICAIAIIGIFAAAGMPRFASAIAARRADAAARRLTADIEWLRSTARISSTSQSMTFDMAGNTYALAGFTDPDFPGKAYSVALTAGSYKAKFVSVNLGGGSTLSFNGYGIPSAAATIVVQSGRSSRTVTIDGTTGSSTWQ